MAEINENGNMNILGMNLSLTETIGNTIVQQWFNQLTEEDLKGIYNQIDDYALQTQRNYNNDELVKILKTEKPGRWSTENTETWNIVKAQVSKQFAERIENEVKRLIETDEVKDKVTKMADDLIEYAINGYKEDLKAIIRERMVGNILGTEPSYMGINLTDIIRSELRNLQIYMN